MIFDTQFTTQTRAISRLTNGPLRGLSFVWLASLMACCGGFAAERTESFDRDPKWDGRNHRSRAFAKRTIKQNFGYSASHRAGGRAPGELGGFITPDARPAFYARRIPPQTLHNKLTASGTVVCTGRQFHVLLGLFNSDTVNDWRTPNTIALRLYGRDRVFYAYLEYATAKWRAGGDNPTPFPQIRDPKTGKKRQLGFATGDKHTWTLQYDPDGNGGRGQVTATIDGQTAVCHLDAGHKADGATFNRFGLLNVMKHADDGGELWLDDMTINGETEHFDQDPKWDALNNRLSYQTSSVRPRFDFGHSPTQHAGGRSPGELGGLVFRGDCRYPDRMAYYGDRVAGLSLNTPLHASGQISLRRGVSDSTTLIGFFHDSSSMRVQASQASGIPRCFAGVAVEGPSREGFLLYPLYRVDGAAQAFARGAARPHILPDGRPHRWTLDYAPGAAQGRGQFTVTLDGHPVTLALGPGHREIGARFNRFGIVTTWVDGNGQRIFFDDLTYTISNK